MVCAPVGDYVDRINDFHIFSSPDAYAGDNHQALWRCVTGVGFSVQLETHVLCGALPRGCSADPREPAGVRGPPPVVGDLPFVCSGGPSGRKGYPV